jgi:hypothetical protein
MKCPPLRRVESVRGPREGCSGIIRGTRSRWWELKLECGHVAERDCRYTAQPDVQPWRRKRGPHHNRSLSDVLPAPKRVRCWQCGDEREEVLG